MEYYDYYNYGMDESVLEFMEEFGFVFLGVILGIALIALVIGIVLYVFQSLGIYAIANRRGIKNAWLAWIPVGYYWVVGSIADQYQYVAKGKIKNKRKILLGLSLGSFAVSLIFNVVFSIVSFTAADAETMLMLNTMGNSISSLVNSALSITLYVFWQMALYDLYSSVSPENNVLFLVLGIFFSFLVPFFIFFNRKKDNGMPPRRQNYAPQQPQFAEPAQPRYTEPAQPQEPWDGPEQL